MEKRMSEENFSERQHGFMLRANGTLAVEDSSGPVELILESVDGVFPSCGEVAGHSELLDEAFGLGKATLTTCGATMEIEVIGINKHTGRMLVSAPALRAVAEYLY